MGTWQENDLQKLARPKELQISPLRGDGKTYRKPTVIWAVALDGAMYVRSYTGKNGRWYQDAIRQKAGRIAAGGITKDVTFEPVDGAINDRIDDAYRVKYKGSPYVEAMIAATARDTTLQVMPRATSAG